MACERPMLLPDLTRPVRALVHRSPLPFALARLDRRLDGAQLEPGQQVLDLGCGEGLLFPLLLERLGAGGRLVGVEPNPSLFEVARARGASVELHLRDTSNTGLPDASFDRIVLHNVFHALKDRGGTVREARRLLKDGGKLWLWEPRGLVRGWQVRAFEGMFLGARFEVEERLTVGLGQALRLVAGDAPVGSRRHR